MSEWRSIADDGWPEPHADYLVYGHTGGTTGVMFEARPCYGMHGPWWTVPWQIGGFTQSDTMPGWLQRVKITHWMPRPDKP